MKKYILKHLCYLTVCSMFLLLSGSSHGVQPTKSSLLEPKDMGRFAMGIVAEQQSRLLSADKTSGWDNPNFDAQTGYALFSADILSWLTFNIGAGAAQVKLDASEDYGNSAPMWITGLNAGLWQYDIMKSGSVACRLHVNGNISYRDYTADVVDTENFTWNEIRSSLTVGAEFPAEGTDHLFLSCPYSLAFFGGCVNSSLSGNFKPPTAWLEPGDSTETDFSEDKATALIAGVNLAITPEIYLCWESMFYDTANHVISLSYYF